MPARDISWQRRSSWDASGGRACIDRTKPWIDRPAMQIALTGDVMLGRLVDQYVIQNRSIGPEKIWSDVLPLMLKADRRLINLECMISGWGREWKPDSKAFHFRAQPRAIDFLSAAKIDCVTLANNHVLDYGTDALI